MPRRPSPHPTVAELEVLTVLWRKGPSTVRQVHQVLQADRDTSLTTTLKLLQVMADKGFVIRSDSRPQRFAAAAPAEQTQANLLRDLARRAFDGSVRKLLIRAVEEGDLSSAELREIRTLINNLSKGPRGGRSCKS